MHEVVHSETHHLRSSLHREEQNAERYRLQLQHERARNSHRTSVASSRSSRLQVENDVMRGENDRMRSELAELSRMVRQNNDGAANRHTVEATPEVSPPLPLHQGCPCALPRLPIRFPFRRLQTPATGATPDLCKEGGFHLGMCPLGTLASSARPRGELNPFLRSSSSLRQHQAGSF